MVEINKMQEQKTVEINLKITSKDIAIALQKQCKELIKNDYWPIKNRVCKPWEITLNITVPSKCDKYLCQRQLIKHIDKKLKEKD